MSAAEGTFGRDGPELDRRAISVANANMLKSLSKSTDFLIGQNGGAFHTRRTKRDGVRTRQEFNYLIANLYIGAPRPTETKVPHDQRLTQIKRQQHCANARNTLPAIS